MRGLICALLLPSLAHADEPPATDFKGIYVGVKIDQPKVVNDFKARCTKTLCSGDTTIAGAPAKVYIAIALDGLVDRINVTFAPGDFPQVVEALVAKFGPAAGSRTSEVQNSYGAKAMQTIMLWERPDGARIAARERADRLSEGDVTFASARDVKVTEFNRKNNIGDL